MVGTSLRRRPTLRRRQSLRPRQTAVVAALHHDSAATVTFRVDGDDGLVVFKQHGGGMAEVLAFFFVDDDLAFCVFVEIDDGDGDGVFGFGLRAES